ncbi:MAG TPA: YeeE/YedE thiosulfate transporter family protein [Steroidobacteraceae bacterium]
MLDWLLLGLAFVFGFGLTRTSVCTVAAVRTHILERDTRSLLCILVAASAAGAVLLGFAWIWPQQIRLPLDSSVPGWALLGGFILGAGALINGGCYLGSITYLCRGNLNFLFTLFGIVAGARFAAIMFGMRIMPAAAQLSGRPYFSAIGTLGCLLVLSTGLWLMASRARNDERFARISRRMGWAAAFCGAVAAVIFARHPNWSYGTLLEQLAAADHAVLEPVVLCSALALFAGAVIGARHRWHWHAPTVLGSGRRFVGGILLSIGALLVPGGNDTLLLWTIPGLASYGFIAFGAMLLTIAGGVLAERHFARPPAPL